MQSIFVTDGNGDTQLILMPENDLDKILLDTLTTNKVDLEKISQHVSILGKTVKDGILIRKKIDSKPDTSQT